jgi:hypothetical protein
VLTEIYICTVLFPPAPCLSTTNPPIVLEYWKDLTAIASSFPTGISFAPHNIQKTNLVKEIDNLPNEKPELLVSDLTLTLGLRKPHPDQSDAEHGSRRTVLLSDYSGTHGCVDHSR